MIIKNTSKKFSVECEVAKSIWKQGIGLSFSQRKRNMLFIMPIEWKWEFWMFGMRYPIKIIFIDENKRVIGVQTAVPLSFNPKTWKIFKPKKPCKFVFELGKNINKKLEIGDKLSW